tara:strand:- start:506 stop:640 length:135 start_codon:yes stop_codon:yes gene_type:complete
LKSQGDCEFVVAVARFELATWDYDAPVPPRIMQKSWTFFKGRKI